MSWYDDLSTYHSFGESAADRLVAVGWLERGKPYTRGQIDVAVAEKMISLLVHPWQPAVSVGHHGCGLCQLTDGPGSLSYNGMTIAMGSNNLFVPGSGLLYVAPSLIAHYIDAHEYLPPQEFCEAVLNCPPMRSMAYLKLILSNGPKGFLGSDC